MATASHTSESHDWGSGAGPEFYGPRHDYREALMLRQLLPALRGDHVLNAGCGAGSLTMKLLGAGRQVTSVDASSAFVEQLRADLAAHHPDRAASVEVGDLAELGFDDEAFDGVVCGEVLEHLDDDLPAVCEFARVLRPAGIVVATVPANPWRYDWFDHWVGHRRRYTPERLSRPFRAAGFQQITVTPWGFPLTGLYHRLVYRRLVRRRVETGGAAPSPVGLGPSGARRYLLGAFRAALEIDSAFLGRRPGYFGLIVTARKQAPRPGATA